MAEPDTYPHPEHGWTCFHCGETFYAPGLARIHFGAVPNAQPGCLMRVKRDGVEPGLLWRIRMLELERDELQVRLAARKVGDAADEADAVSRFHAMRGTDGMMLAGLKELRDEAARPVGN